MEAFLNYILQFGSLNKQQIDLVSSKARILQLQKDEYFWEAGKAVRQIGFITDGVLRVYYYTNRGDEITRYFIDEQHLIMDGHAADELYVPAEYLQAITDCRLVVFSKENWREISATIVVWDRIIQKITAKLHKEKLERRSDLVSQDAATRYRNFLEKFPSLVNRVPLAFIASYLGITQSSLSRIRKTIR
jgi:cAMP-binding proteins - catabolite gene activator and regulatory subunit of cAMP-dependent protein kinases